MITMAYGALAPTEGLDLLRDQIWRANRYRNELIALRRHERERMAVAKKDGLPDWWLRGTHLRVLETERSLRKTSGLGWGTYMLIEAAVKQSKKSDGEMRFRRGDGTGRVAGLAPTGRKRWNHEHSPGFIVAPPDARGRTTARIRLIRDEWITLPIVLHRPIPPGVIAQVYVMLDRIGTRWVYGLRVVSHAERAQLVTGNGRVSINFGWRRVEDGVCVATAVGDGGIHELVLPLRLLEKYRHSESLRSLADIQAVQHIGDSRYRTRKRSEGLAEKSADTLILRKKHLTAESSLHHWALRDRHLYQWERDEYRRAIRQRRSLVLAWVQSLAKNYHQVTVETYSLSSLVRRGCIDIPESRHVRFLVAPGELRSVCATIFGDGLEKLSRKSRTMLCSVCGDELSGDRKRSKVLRCERCDAEVDQDVNNAKNQHAEAAE